MTKLRLKYQAENRKAWNDAIRSAFGEEPPRSGIWFDIPAMISTLRPIIGPDLNHALLGTGGQDILSIAHSRERGHLTLNVSDKVAYVVKPASLEFEYIKQAPEASFYLMDLQPIQHSGTYDVVNYDQEELLEVDGKYYERSWYDEGFLGFDEHGKPIPRTARIVVRFLYGKILFVAKSSTWNRLPQAYSGLHLNMSAKDIRYIIEEGERRYSAHD